MMLHTSRRRRRREAPRPVASATTPRHTTDLVGEYLVSCAAGGLAKKTISSYAWALAYTPELLPCTARALEMMVANADLSPVSKLDIYRAWSAFFAWAESRYGLPDPVSDVRRPRVRPKPIRIFTPDELVDINEACKTPRELAMISVLLDTGIRLGELANLRWADVGSKFITVDGKTGPREVPYSPEVRPLLVGLGDPPHLWVGRKGPLTVSGCSQAVEKVVRGAGIEGPRTLAHAFRHTFATEYLRAGGNIFKLQRILGHTKLDMTMRYVHLVRDDLAERHEELSPLRLVWRNDQVREEPAQ